MAVKNNIYKIFINIKNRGMSLMEVVVTVAIISILSVIMYSAYPEANAIMGFNLTTQEVVSRIKNAQIYGASQGGNYKGQGLFFDTSLSANNTIVEFLDIVSGVASSTGVLNSNKYFDDNLLPYPDTLMSKEIIKNSLIINKLYVQNTSGATSSSNKLSVTFVRPDTTAYITNMLPSTAPSFYDKAYIELKSKLVRSESGNLRCIIIYKSGQIDVNNGPC